MSASAYDIELGGKGYLLVPGGYMMSESPKSFPARGTASTSEFQHPDNWSYFGQSDWSGEGNVDWLADGPYNEGYGLDLSTPGEINVAKQLALRVADAVNVGYITFSVGTTRSCWIGKTNGVLYTPDSSTVAVKTPGDVNYLAASNFPVSYGSLKGKHYIGTSTGKIWETTDGLVYTDKLSGGPSTPAYILDSFKGKLWVGYANQMFTFDGTTWKEVFGATTTPVAPGKIDGTPIAGVAGSGGLYFVTDGPNAKLFLTDENALHQLSTIRSDYKPTACVFLETLYIFGKRSDDTNTAGQVWRLTQAGLVPIFEFGDDTQPYGINSAMLNGATILWSASSTATPGIGIFDPSMDVYEDTQLGFYVSSTAAINAVVHGLNQFANILYAGLVGSGIYWQTTPGPYLIRSSRWDGESKNVNKMWGFGEVRHSALLAGQTVAVKTSKDDITYTTWGTSSTVAATAAIISAPANYKNPFIQYEISGTANGSTLTIYDIALAFIESSDNPKREWDLVIGLEGSADRPQILRDGTDNDRTATTMFSALNGLWNTVTTFKDIDNTTYNVVMKMPRAKAEEFIKDVDSGNALVELVLFYRLHLTQL